jgi:hypothetical protein
MKCLAMLGWHRGSNWSGRSTRGLQVVRIKSQILLKQSGGATFEIVTFYSFILILTTYE